MEEQNQNKDQNVEETVIEEAVEVNESPAASKLATIHKFEMPSFFAMLITLGLYACSAMLIMALAQ